MCSFARKPLPGNSDHGGTPPPSSSFCLDQRLCLCLRPPLSDVCSVIRVLIHLLPYVCPSFLPLLSDSPSVHLFPDISILPLSLGPLPRRRPSESSRLSVWCPSVSSSLSFDLPFSIPLSTASSLPSLASSPLFPPAAVFLRASSWALLSVPTTPRLLSVCPSIFPPSLQSQRVLSDHLRVSPTRQLPSPWPRGSAALGSGVPARLRTHAGPRRRPSRFLSSSGLPLPLPGPQSTPPPPAPGAPGDRRSYFARRQDPALGGLRRRGVAACRTPRALIPLGPRAYLAARCPPPAARALPERAVGTSASARPPRPCSLRAAPGAGVRGTGRSERPLRERSCLQRAPLPLRLPATQPARRTS